MSTASPPARSRLWNRSGCRSRRYFRHRRKARSDSRRQTRKRSAPSRVFDGAFSAELSSGLIDNVTAKPGIAVVAVVGDGMAGTPGIAARVFSALASARINVVAIARSSERNISFAVKTQDVAEAARVHAAFQP